YAGGNFVIKQAVWYGAGITFIFGLFFVDLTQLYKTSIFVYAFGVVILIILRLSPESIAKTINGAKSWFTGIPGLSLQPSEFTKIALILFIGAIISHHRDKYAVNTVRSDIYLLLKIISATALPVLFTIIQPDLGTSLVYVFIAGELTILSGIDWKILSTLIVGGGAIGDGIISLVIKFPELSQQLIGIKPYQINRVLTWFDPTQQGNDTFQIDRSKLAVGSGQLTGKGMSG